MGLIGWLIIIALAYIVVGKTMFILIDAVQRRKWEHLAMVVIGATLFIVLQPLLMYPLTHARKSVGETYVYVDRSSLLLELGVILGLLVVMLFAADVVFKQLHKPTWQDTRRRKALSRQIKLHLALATGALVFSVPFYWLITTSLKPDERTNVFPPEFIPRQQSSVMMDGEKKGIYLLDRDGKQVKVVKVAELENDEWEVSPVKQKNVTWTVPHAQLREDLHFVMLWSNYSGALKFLPPEYKGGVVPLWNTVYVTLLVIVGTIFSSSLVAFSFARLRWPGRDVLFVVLLATMMIPPAVTMLPVFLIFRQLNWIDTLRPLWVPAFFGGAFNVFLLRQFFMTIPNDLEDAAKIDGCSYFTIYWKIMLPLIKPALAALTIFAFMGSWNNFMGPLIYISSPEKMTLSYALQLFQGAHGGEPAMMMAAATMVMLPVLAVFFFTQRYMIQGVTLTGIKG